MRILFSIATIMAATALQAYAWIHPIPDYKKQLEDADVVAIVRVSGVTNTGATKRLNTNSRLEFRECEVEMQIVSLFKGRAAKALKCRLYRFPTEKERRADLGEREAAVEYMKATPWESCLFVPTVHKDYLVYLKRSADGYYQTVTGSSVHNILKLTASFVTDPDKEAELGGSANGSQPIRSQTNRTPSAAGSRR